MSTFYVYEHWRPDRDECFYVGKGRGVRANSMSRRNLHHKAVQAKLARGGLATEVRVVAGGLSEEAAFALEVERIAFWRAAGVDLTNKTTGGEGNAGHTQSAETTAKIVAKLKGRKHTAAARAKMSASLKGKNSGKTPRLGIACSEETKAKISAANKGKQSFLGRSHSAATKAKISKAVSRAIQGPANPFFGKAHTAETKARISAAVSGDLHNFFGKKHSPETRAKMSAALKASASVRCAKAGATRRLQNMEKA